MSILSLREVARIEEFELMIRDTFELNPGLAELFKKKILDIARDVQFPDDLIDFESHIDIKGTYSDNLRIFYREYPRLSERSDFLKKNPIRPVTDSRIERTYRAYQINNGETPEPITRVMAIANTGETLTEPTTPSYPKVSEAIASYPTLSFSFNYSINTYPETRPEPKAEVQARTPEPEPNPVTVNLLESILPRNLPDSTGLGDNAIKQRTIAIYGHMDYGKTNTVRWIVEQAVEIFGQQAVNVQVANAEDYLELLKPDCWTPQPIQIIVLENVTYAELSDDSLRDFFRMRDIMEQYSKRRNGLCLVLFTFHSFNKTPKSIRENCDGLVVISAPPTWQEYDHNYLKRAIGKDNLAWIEGKKIGLNDEHRSAVIVFRNLEAARIEIPKLRPGSSFMYQKQQYWKKAYANYSEDTPIEAEGESSVRYKLHLPRLPRIRIEKPEKSERQEKKQKEDLTASAVFTLFSTLLLAASYPPNTLHLALICLGYASGFVMFARWVKVKLVYLVAAVT